MFQARPQIMEILSDMYAFRRTAHQNPQTAFEETFISGEICKTLDEWDIPYERGIGQTGVVATIENGDGPTVGLRADIDALNIQEAFGVDWISETIGKMHACGHDGHTAIVLTALYALHKGRNFKGTVKGIFQPGEEAAEGAQRMIDDGMLERHPMDFIYGLHNWPALPEGEIAVHTKGVMACSDYYRIRVRGIGGHAATPHRANNVIKALPDVLKAIARLSDDEAVVETTVLDFGTRPSPNVIKNRGIIKGTVRTFSDEKRTSIQRALEAEIPEILKPLHLKAKIRYDRVINPTINHPDEALICRDIAENVLGPENVHWDFPPEKTADDFGVFLEHIPGAYIWVGQSKGEGHPSHYGLHNQHYDFNDDIIPIGAEFLVSLVERKLGLDIG